jgi:hypothetical protein
MTGPTISVLGSMFLPPIPATANPKILSCLPTRRFPKSLPRSAKKEGVPPFRWLAGGAVFLGGKTEQNTGQLIIEAAREALKKVGLEITLEQTGDNKIRCMVLDIDGGKIKIT